MSETQRRETNGRFGERTGSAPEVTLPVEPTVPSGYTLVPERETPRLEGFYTKADIARASDFVTRHGVRVAARNTGRYVSSSDEFPLYKVQFLMNDGRRVKGQMSEGKEGAVDSTLHLIWLARQARDHGAGYEKSDRVARSLFGDEYDSLVNPEPPTPNRATSFWRWLNEKV